MDILIFIFTLSVTFLTFLTFIGKSFIDLNDNNLQYLLLANLILLIVFFILIIVDIKNSIKNNINVRGSIANRKYIISFALFTLIPSLLIAIFSLFIFSFALEKYFDKKITSAVNNSYEIAKNYLDEKRNKIESEIVLIAFDLNKYSKNYLNHLFNTNEMLGSMLLTLHNINFYQELMSSIRNNIKNGTFHEFHDKYISKL